MRVATAVMRHAVVTGLVLAGLTVGSVAAGTGLDGTVNLGRTNTYDGTTVISGAAGAPLVSVRNRSGTAADFQVPSSVPPFTVNSSRRVVNLNADRLDGVHASDLQRRVSGECPVGAGIRVVDANGSVTCGRPFLRTVVVAPIPADPVASGLALRRALAGITTATAAEPWLLRIEPGTYALGTSPLTLKPHVHLEGSGRRATILARAGVAAGVPAAVVAVPGIEMRSLSVRSTGGTNATGVSLAPAAGVSVPAFRLSDVDVTASRASGRNIAIAATGGTSLVLEGVAASASDGSTALALHASGASATVRGATLVATDAGSGASYGILVTRPEDVTGPLRVVVTGSVLGGRTAAVSGVASVATRIAASEVRRGTAAAVVGAGVRCAGVHDQDFTFHPGTCP